ncbi:MAG TPA: hypothetical protein VJ761_12150 [Ktedonobacteraceae bacterium]|nr:hypothetical protein [Ktedonobacteraceae bacterium]
MNKHDERHEEKQPRQQEQKAAQHMEIEVRIRQPRCDCPIYEWDRELECMRLSGIYRAERGLPADLATCRLEARLEVPVLLLTSYSSPPGTLVRARLIGALYYAPIMEAKTMSLPSDNWICVAVAAVDASLSGCLSLEMLPAPQLASLKTYVQTTWEEGLLQDAAHSVACAAADAAHLLRETRLALKRERRMQSKGKRWLKREEEERPVAWRAIEGLSEALRMQLQKDALLQDAEMGPHAQAEQLIRFVHSRFQQALADLLLDDERLLAFVERPLLRHRTGWLGMQTWRSNEGILLVTDRQVLWLRDFLTPGSNFLSGGYIAHMAPLERLERIIVLPAGDAPAELAPRLETKDSPYTRLVMEVACASGRELFVVEFPQEPELDKALAHITSILRAFLPQANGYADRHLRRLPSVEPWMPQGAEAAQIAGLGGIVPAAIAQPLEQQLARLVDATREELLASALVPALEDYASPPRLVALTRHALLVIEHGAEKHRPFTATRADQHEHVQNYELAAISSAQLRYSLVGSSLSIFVPGPSGHTQQQVIPFHSPAIAWFLPLFTRLRLLLSEPYRNN